MAANKPNSKSWASRAFREEPLSFIWNGEKTAPRLLEDIKREFVEEYLHKHPNHAVIRKPSKSAIASHPRTIAVLSFIGIDGGYKHQQLEIKHMYKPYDLHYTLTDLGGNKNWEIMYDINYENADDFFNVTQHKPQQGGRKSRSKKSKSRRSKSRRSKKSKGRSRKQRK